MSDEPSTCECGAGFQVSGNVCFLTPHDPDCPVLHRIVEIGRQGYCCQCGSKLRVKRGGVWRHEWCPKGCRYSSEARGV